MQGLGLRPDVERVHGHGPLAELVVGAGILRQHQHAVAPVDERPLLGDEVHAVVDGVHEQDVVLLVGGDRLRERVGDLDLDRAGVSLAQAPGLRVDRLAVGDVLGDRLARRVEPREELDAPTPLRVLVEQDPERAEAADDVLRRIGAIDAHDELLGSLQRALCGEHAVVYGRPAIALPLANVRARVRVESAAPGAGITFEARQLRRRWSLAARRIGAAVRRAASTPAR